MASWQLVGAAIVLVGMVVLAFFSTTVLVARQSAHDELLRQVLSRLDKDGRTDDLTGLTDNNNSNKNNSTLSTALQEGVSGSSPRHTSPTSSSGGNHTMPVADRSETKETAVASSTTTTEPSTSSGQPVQLQQLLPSPSKIMQLKGAAPSVVRERRPVPQVRKPPAKHRSRVARLFQHEVPGYFQFSVNVSMSGQPTELGFLALQKAGVRSVLSLRTLQEGVAAERSLVTPLGIRFFNVPIDPSASADQMLNDQNVQMFADVVHDCPKPLLIHCLSGPRAGALWYTYRTLYEGTHIDEALAEARHIGLLPRGVLEQIAVRFVERRITREFQDYALRHPRNSRGHNN
eukprot:gnl/Spiro4/17270_TR9192_c0_g1_i1.p1 gnl/Spiro4/17270_TR9192_c0_g1~~gnl/Spiro4/17270_TR9192_c0_g1_i1.p1  ORF type:complete len:346 (-),score=34.39 gnl/Spiro4/17270_TR9192_c0_g1_i1:100-1137(-)